MVGHSGAWHPVIGAHARIRATGQEVIVRELSGQHARVFYVPDVFTPRSGEAQPATESPTWYELDELELM
jgi:hypothetical protein